MTDNEEIQYQLTISHLGMFNIPMSDVENVDLTNGSMQAAILDCLTREQMLEALAVYGGRGLSLGY